MQFIYVAALIRRQQGTAADGSRDSAQPKIDSVLETDAARVAKHRSRLLSTCAGHVDVLRFLHQNLTKLGTDETDVHVRKTTIRIVAAVSAYWKLRMFSNSNYPIPPAPKMPVMDRHNRRAHEPLKTTVKQKLRN